MTEKEIEQKFKTEFRKLFPTLKDATAIPVAALPKDSSESGRMADIILRLRVGDKFKNVLCEGVSLCVMTSAATRTSYSEELPELQRYP